jgi:hypothetical protein
VDFDVTELLLIRYFSHSSKTGEKWKYYGIVLQFYIYIYIYIDMEKAEDSGEKYYTIFSLNYMYLWN